LQDGTDRPTPSLVKRLIASAVLWTLPVLALTAIALTWLYRSSTYQLFDDPLENTITYLISNADSDRNNRVFLEREPIDPDFQRALSGRYWMVGEFTADGKLNPLQASRSLSGESLNLPVSIKEDVENQTRGEFRTSSIGPDQEPLRVLARSVILPNSQQVMIIAAADIREPQSDIRRFAFLATLLMLIVSAGLVAAIFWQVRNGLRPLFALRQRVADVREGRAERVDGTYPSEIAPLAEELNTLIHHNKDVVERARTHVSNLAHGLKTPLAVLQNEAQSSRSGLSIIVKRQTESMKRQVDHHLWKK